MDDLQQMLLSRIAGENADVPPLSLPDLVEQSMGEDPMASALAAALRQREAKLAEEAGDGEGALEDPDVADVVERLYAELEELRERTRMLADALGACPRCFGEDELCPVCRGRGRPGGRVPDQSLFERLVAPAQMRLFRSVGPVAAEGVPAELSMPNNDDVGQP
jgi:hypothetical protein